MTILFFSRSFHPKIGGVEKHVLELSKRLLLKGHKVIVFTEEISLKERSHYQSHPQSAIPEGIVLVRVSAGTESRLKKFRVWLGLLRHISLIRSADIIHCHDIFYWYLPFRFLFPFKKVYTTFHGYEGNKIPTKKAILMHKLSEKLSDGNICVGDFLKKWYGTYPTFVTYGAVDIEKINEYRKTINLPMKNKIIFFGRLEEETGIMKYVRAFKTLQKENGKLSLDIYGEGSLSRLVKEYSLKNKLRIHLKKFIPNIESVLNNYEYVFCSRYLGILESLAFQKPVFAEYNNKIKKDYLTMTPFANYISIFSSEKDIIEQFGKYSLNKQNKSLKLAYDWVKDQSWEHMVRLYLKLWKS